MKKLLMFSFIFALTFSLYAQEEMSHDMQEEMSDMQKAWTEFMTPGEHHKILAKAAGDWTYTAKYWDAPGMEAKETEGTASSKMILEGRYLKTSLTGMFYGMSFEGMSIEAYDNAKEKFVSIWIDNMGTGIAFAEGQYDMEKKELVYEGTSTNPVTKDDVWFKEVLYSKDDGTKIMDMYGKTEDGTEFKTMEFVMTKK